jgi:hypothetical protein
MNEIQAITAGLASLKTAVDIAKALSKYPVISVLRARECI